ncbi:MAG: redoxin domain-containing protein [Rhodothermales bacterium]
MTLHIPLAALLTFFAWMLPVHSVVAQEAPLGTTMPLTERSMSQADGSSVTLAELQGNNATVLLFWSNQCPWTERYEGRVEALVNEFRTQGISFVFVNSNDPAAYPQESRESSLQYLQNSRLDVAYVMDDESTLAEQLGASRTPHAFVFDENNRLVYVGSIDDSPGDPGNVERQYLRDALQALLNDAAVEVAKTKGFGCTIRFHQ